MGEINATHALESQCGSRSCLKRAEPELDSTLCKNKTSMGFMVLSHEAEKSFKNSGVSIRMQTIFEED